jgi:hypothetical protein
MSERPTAGSAHIIAMTNDLTLYAKAAQHLPMTWLTQAPERVNSWAEYASKVPNLNRVFAFAGLERHEKEKQATAAARVDVWLAERARHADTTNTVRADELSVGAILAAVDVGWWSHTPARVTYLVSAVDPAADGKITISFTSTNDRDRALTVPADRRFLMAKN